MRASRFLYVVGVAFIVAAIVTLVSATNVPDATFANARIAASALLAATAGWIINNAISLHVKVGEASFKYLQDVISNLEATSLSAKLVSRWQALNIEPFKDDATEVERFFLAAYPHDEFFELMRKLANFYEQMAVAIQRDTVDERMIRIFFASTLRWFFTRLEPFLPFYRNLSGNPAHPNGSLINPGTFAETEWLNRRWRGYDEIEANPWTKPIFGFAVVGWLRLRWHWRNLRRVMLAEPVTDTNDGIAE